MVGPMMPLDRRARRFPTTHWSAIHRAGLRGDSAARRSLADLCRAYWAPLVAYLVRRGFSSTDAEDHVQGFLTQFIDGQSIARADADRGRFRSYLLGAMKRFMAQQHEYATAQRRGGDVATAVLDDAVLDRVGARTAAYAPEAEFDRRWAQVVLSNVRTRMRAEHEARGQGERFAVLEPHFFDVDPPCHASTAARLGMAEGAVKVAVHRLRRRFGELLREEVATTVDDPRDVDDEIRALLVAAQ